MTTKTKGEAFEERVFEALAAEVQAGRLWVSPNSVKVFKKRAYYSRDRDSNVITDVAIEAYLPGRDRPSLVWVFECKDYSGAVPVDDLEEFHAKLQQIGEDNTKGTFVTSGALQRGALAYARSKKIGVVRLLPDSQIIHVIEFLGHRGGAKSVQTDWSEFDSALTVSDHRSRRGFFAAMDGFLFGNWHSVLSHELPAGGGR